MFVPRVQRAARVHVADTAPAIAVGIAELIVWDRAITELEMREIQGQLVGRYGLVAHSPPAPPAPAAVPTVPALAASLSKGMIAHYSTASFTSTSQQTGVWQSAVSAVNTVSVTGIDLETDAPGTAGNSVPISYVSGGSTTKIVFPEPYANYIQMTMCAVRCATCRQLLSFARRGAAPGWHNICACVISISELTRAPPLQVTRYTSAQPQYRGVCILASVAHIVYCCG